MTTIDHRILIPAPPDVVWAYISDISHNPTWQVDCQEIVFLTSRREGPGLRWRYTAPGGHEYVIAVTAWYNGLGYEYYFVDGVAFKENIGRVRLQEIPEGTVVQWTFTYELGGVLSGVRNSLGISRQIDHTIADSLKTLWQQLKQSTPGQALEPKSLIREAPDVQQRSSYQPRHPSAAAEVKPPVDIEPPVSGDDAQPIRVIDEPPIAQEDTKPRRPVTPEPEPKQEEIPSDIDGEPEFLTRMTDFSRFEPPVQQEDTKPRRPVTPEEIAAPPTEAPSAPVPESLTQLTELPDEETPIQETVPTPPPPIEESQPEPEPDIIIDPAKTPSQPLPPVEIHPPSTTDNEADEASSAETLSTEIVPPTQPAEIEPTPAIGDTDTTSIWDVFGVPRPSESQEVAAVQPEPPKSEVKADLTLPERASYPRPSSHIGMRIAIRRKLVHLRRP